MIRINTQTSAESTEHKIELIDKLKKEEENDWEFPIDSSLKIVELLNCFHKVHFLLSELLGLKFDFDDFYKFINSPFSDFYISDFDTVDNSDIKIIKDILNRILVALQKIGLEEKKIENLLELVFIINKCECKYDANGNIFVKKLKNLMDDIYENVINDFTKIIEFTKERDRDIFKINNNDDIVLINRICDNSISVISNKLLLQQILRKISRNGILNKIIYISKQLCELKLEICNL
ncbi:hypothetical protein GND98_017335 [Clostridium butyricum]|uniref:Uncharacterized protein n=1 Tax=Clostridium butyricum TaxID=1492 RepID=A0A6L9ESI0_CLOBU|nr:hypothetical protein [Clostridium butyricum]